MKRGDKTRRQARTLPVGFLERLPFLSHRSATRALPAGVPGSHLRSSWRAGLMMLCWFAMPGSVVSAAEPPPPMLSVFRHAPYPGGVAVVDLPVVGAVAPTVMFGDSEVAVAGDADTGWWAVLGIDLKTRPGKHRLVVTTDTGEESRVPVVVEPRSYEEQRITLKNKRQVNPSPVDMERIRRESAKIATARRSRGEQLMAGRFQWPVKGPVSSPFGLRRFFNGEPRRPHGGIDIAMPTGTPIVAPAAGTVVDIGEYFFNGNSVFIEHGLGLQSFYAHLSRIDVQAGDTVSAGQTIGAIGATGRVTGPHLHWSVSLNGAWVDPMLFVESRD